jgi:hypothetical protein
VGGDVRLLGCSFVLLSWPAWARTGRKWSEMQGDDAGYGVTPMPAAFGACRPEKITHSIRAGLYMLQLPWMRIISHMI